MAMYPFGTGLVYFVPSGANPTPIQIGVVQGISLKVSEKTVKLYGDKKFAVDIKKGEGEISGKIKFAQFNSKILSAILTGSTSASGIKTGTTQTAVIPTTPFQITVTNSATFSEDGGVYDNTAAKWLTNVASAPATGQYSYSAGVYTFAAADVAHSVSISYSYTTAGTGSTTTYNNQVMGAATLYALRIANNADGKANFFELPAVVISGLSLELANTAHMAEDLDFEAQADATGLVLKQYGAE